MKPNPSLLLNPLLLSCLLLATLLFAGCSDKVTAAGKVMAKKAESQWVELAGKGETALELYRTRHEQLRENLIRIRSSIKSTERKLAQTKSRIEGARAVSPAPSPELIKMEESLAASYEKSLATFRAAEKTGTEALEKSRNGYETLKAQVELLNEQIANARATIHLDELAKPGNSQAEIKTLIGSLETDLDLAEATLSMKDINLE